MRSAATLPVHRITRCTASASGDVGSDSTSSNEPCVKSRRVLGEQRVVDEEASAVVRLELTERRELGPRPVVDEDGVPLRERAATRVLSGQPHRLPFDDQGTPRELFAERPVDPVALELAEL